jgi:uncharacterized membrane protein YidH (DUF202 family)
MAIVSTAIILSFHLKETPSETEKQIALPFGAVFWVLSGLCLLSGTANYVTTVTKYSRRQALVQAGWKTQTIFTVVAIAIVVACILFLSMHDSSSR